MTRTEDLSDADPRDIARALLAEFGFGQDQFGCLDSLWTRESNWRVDADNPNSSAYGIPQALPGSKMASAGADWATNPVTQIRWGLGYIEDRYGSPCGAWGAQPSPRLVLSPARVRADRVSDDASQAVRPSDGSRSDLSRPE